MGHYDLRQSGHSAPLSKGAPITIGDYSYFARIGRDQAHWPVRELPSRYPTAAKHRDFMMTCSAENSAMDHVHATGGDSRQVIHMIYGKPRSRLTCVGDRSEVHGAFPVAQADFLPPNLSLASAGSVREAAA